MLYCLLYVNTYSATEYLCCSSDFLSKPCLHYLLHILDIAVVLLGTALVVSHPWLHFVYLNVIFLCIVFYVHFVNRISFSISLISFLSFQNINCQFLAFLYSIQWNFFPTSLRYYIKAKSPPPTSPMMFDHGVLNRPSVPVAK